MPSEFLFKKLRVVLQVLTGQNLQRVMFSLATPDLPRVTCECWQSQMFKKLAPGIGTSYAKRRRQRACAFALGLVVSVLRKNTNRAVVYFRGIQGHNVLRNIFYYVLRHKC